MDVVVNDSKEHPPAGSEPLVGQENYYQNILVGLGFKSENLPLAKFLSLYHHLPEGQWLVASPIHWEATHNDAMIVATGSGLDLDDSESRLWFAEVARFLQDDHFEPFFHDGQTWLFRINGKPQITSRPVQSMLHQSIMPTLNSLDSSLYWQRLITELQMYLSAHPLNLQRENKLPINGLWFWGEGEFKIIEKRPAATDDEKLLNLGLAEISALTSETIIEKNHLIIINDQKEIELCHLNDKISKNKVHWYWNNLAYSTRATHWWSRFI